MEELTWIIYPTSNELYTGFHIGLNKILFNCTFKYPSKRDDVLRVKSNKQLQEVLILLSIGMCRADIEELLNDKN